MKCVLQSYISGKFAFDSKCTVLDFEEPYIFKTKEQALRALRKSRLNLIIKPVDSINR